MRRTGNEGLHTRVVEDRREQQEERMTWKEVAEALLEAYHAVDCVPDPGVSGHALLGRMKSKLERAQAMAALENSDPARLWGKLVPR